MSIRTFTIDVASLVYTDAGNLPHTITQNETFALDFTDTGTGGVYKGDGSNTGIACTDGFLLEVEGDPAFTNFTVDANGAVTNPGYITFKEEGRRCQWKVISVNFTDADGTGANNLVSITLERVDNPMITMTLTNVNMA